MVKSCGNCDSWIKMKPIKGLCNKYDYGWCKSDYVCEGWDAIRRDPKIQRRNDKKEIKRGLRMSKCIFCNGKKVIQFKSMDKAYSHLGIMEYTCPCVEIDRQKFIGLQYKQLAITLNNTVQEVCTPVGKLMSAARSIGDNTAKFFKSQMKTIGEL